MDAVILIDTVNQSGYSIKYRDGIQNVFSSFSLFKKFPRVYERFRMEAIDLAYRILHTFEMA